MSNRTIAILFLIPGLVNFFTFAYDIQNDRDFWTWIWLLNSQLFFMGCLRFFIIHDREESKQ